MENWRFKARSLHNYKRYKQGQRLIKKVNYWLTGNTCSGEKLPICKAQESLKPECTIVHEANQYNLANFCSNTADG